MTVEMEPSLWDKVSMNVHSSPLCPSLGYNTFMTQVAWSGIN